MGLHINALAKNRYSNLIRVVKVAQWRKDAVGESQNQHYRGYKGRLRGLAKPVTARTTIYNPSHCAPGANGK